MLRLAQVRDGLSVERAPHPLAFPVLLFVGVAILVLTAVVRLVLWPLQSKANQTMRKTALLGPKMQELREKYKDDPTRMNQEVMKMYKQYGINPVGGCLPMAI